MKPHFLFIILLFLSCPSVFSQNKNSNIDLQWKLKPGDTLRYKTVMDAKTTMADTTSMFAGLAKSAAAMNNNVGYTTAMSLSAKNSNLINIVMYTGDGKESNAQPNENIAQLLDNLKAQDRAEKKNKKDKKKKSKKKKEDNDTAPVEDSLMAQNFFKGFSAVLNNKIVLRGCIAKNGTIVSNYYKTSQMNLIATLFELPGRPVKVGEVWQAHVKLMEMDQNFVADSVAETNKVYIEKIEEVDGNSIAVIKYDVSSFVSGDFNNPMAGMMGMKEDGKIFMRISHAATARFNITTGRLESYEGLMTNESDAGFLGGKSETIFRLIP